MREEKDMKYLIYNRSIRNRGFVKNVFVSGYDTTVEFSIKQADAIQFDNQDNALLLGELLKRCDKVMDYSIWEVKD